MDDMQIEPRAVKQRLDRGDKFLLVDVREPWEHEICRIKGAKLIPMGALAGNLATLEQDEEVVLYCHHGIRSLDAAAWLRAQGVEGAWSLAGGIERWATEIDPRVARY
ncbi:MAG: rhodanese-like domain-containing protein [Candidatus Acidiferrales bacterium]